MLNDKLRSLRLFSVPQSCAQRVSVISGPVGPHVRYLREHAELMKDGEISHDEISEGYSLSRLDTPEVRKRAQIKDHRVKRVKRIMNEFGFEGEMLVVFVMRDIFGHRDGDNETYIRPRSVELIELAEGKRLVGLDTEGLNIFDL